MRELEDQLASGFSRAVTRSKFVRTVMRTALVAGTAASGGLLFSNTARAGSCGAGVVGTWGCFCAGTATCPGGGTDCGSHRRRCDYWPNSPYCWCSLTCCYANGSGFYSCCDCWNGGSGGCLTAGGGTKCVAKHFHFIGPVC